LTGVACLLSGAALFLNSGAARAQVQIQWSGTASSSTWATGTNWVGGSAPQNSLTTNIAYFDSTSFTTQPNAGTTSIAGIVVGDGTTAVANLTISTTVLSIGSSGILINAAAGTVTLGPVTLGASQSWANNSSNLLTLGTVSNIGNVTPFTLTVNGSGSGGITFGGIISNGGSTGTTAIIVNTTGGTTTFNAANTFTGGFTVKAGTVSGTLSSADAFGLGGITLGDTVADTKNVTLLYSGTTAIAQAITLNTGTTGTISISNTTNTSSFTGTMALNNNLTVDNGTSGKTTTFSTGAWTEGGSSNLTITRGPAPAPSRFPAPSSSPAGA
jgi:hypothetical protein